MASPDELATRSPDFCWDTVVFKVENTIFRVPRFEFAASSPLFETMFLLPIGEGGDPQEVEGSFDQNPIRLEGYRAVDFDALLRVLYPTEFTIQHLSTLSPSLSPVEKVSLGRDHQIVSWVVEGLMALTWVDRQLSPDALAEAVGICTALRIYTARLRLASNHAKIRPIAVPSGQRTGIAIADLCYGCCWKPVFVDEVKPCQSCSSVRIANESGSVYVAATPALVTSEWHCYFPTNTQDIRCASCHDRFIVETVFCPNCNASLHSGHLNIYLGRGSSLILSTESLIREIFADEIREYEARGGPDSDPGEAVIP